MYHVSCINVELRGPWNKRFMLALQIINQAKSVCIIILLLRANCSYETKQTNGPQPFYSRVQTQIYAFNTCFIMLRSEFDLVLISWPRSQHFDIWHRGQWPVTSDHPVCCHLTWGGWSTPRHSPRRSWPGGSAGAKRGRSHNARGSIPGDWN